MEASLKEKLNNDLKQAMKGGDTVRRSVFRLALSAIQNAEIAKQADLENNDIIGVLAKEARQRQESIQAFREGNRPDLAVQEETELAILQEYLPQQITRDEVIAEARRIIEAVGAQGPGDKGKVMSKIIAELKGKADGREINEVVTELLQSI
ncbi:GatB/YqeY domain-containing protein [Chloroflexota bacterium]